MFFRKLVVHSTSIGWVIGSLILATSPDAHAANTIGFSSLGSGCVTSYTNGYFESNRYAAKSNVTIAAINFLIGTGSTANFSTSRLYIFSENSTYNTPDTAVATFTPDVITGSGTSTAGRFVGSYTLTAGTKFWIVPSVNASVLPWCYWNGVTTSSLTMNGIVADTSTSLSNSSFRKVYEGAAVIPAPNGWDFSADTGQLWQLSIELGASGPITSSLTLSDGSKYATYRTATSLSANVNASAKVTFYSGGKLIAGCRNIVSAAGVATCNWKPSTKGVNRITARVTSLDSGYVDGWATPTEIIVVQRTTTR
jgi:hypothetical protein